jgi:O-antigen ligase
MAMYLLVAVWVFTSFTKNAGDFRFALIGLVCVGTLLAGAVLITRSGYVLGLHKNGVGGSLATAVIVCAELWFSAPTRRQRRILGVTMAVIVAGLFFSLSRGGWIGAAFGVFLLLALRREFKLMVRVGAMMVPLIAICWMLLPQQSKAYATGFDKENWNIRLRYMSMDFAKSQFASSPVLGVGVGLRKEYDATNVFLLTLAETGLVGMAAFLYLHLAVARMVWSTRRIIQRDEVLFSVLALGGALVLSKFIHGMVDHYWSRGAIMIAWAAAGMATHAYFISRRRLGDARRRANERELLIDSTTMQTA